MDEPFLGELLCVSFNYAPKGWALCNGQFLPINQNQALFSLLGTTYGGNGQTTFALPDLRGRGPVHFGSGISLGERAGAETVTLTSSQMPQHIHLMKGDATTAAASNFNVAAAGRSLGNSIGVPSQGATFVENVYDTAVPGAALHASTIGNTGGSQAHNNMQPYLTLNWIIALQGIFPSPT
jgi:microcystin-dependent protein